MSDQLLVFKHVPQEERANTITHAVGIGLSLIGLWALVSYASTLSDPARLTAVWVYGLSMVFLFLASTLYHGIGEPGLKRIFQFIDHVSIYLLIAGSYTPVALITIRDHGGWTLLWVVWGLAFAGIVFKALCFGRFESLSLAIYLAMGWLGLAVAGPIVAAVPVAGLALLVSGGLLYTFGCYFFVHDHKPNNHAIWHVCVIAGTICHFSAVFWYLLPGV